MSALQIQARLTPVALDPAKTALIVIDMQNAFGSPGGMFDKAGVPIAEIQAAVEPTRCAVEAARTAGLPIVFIKMGFKSDLSEAGREDGPHFRFFSGFGIKEGALERDTWATEILDQLTPAAGDTVVWKTRFSAFHGTELDDILKKSGITSLVVTGCTTSVCVEATLRDAFFLDYDWVVLEDCTAEPMAGLSSNPEATALLFQRVFGSLSTSADFASAVARLSNPRSQTASPR